MFNEDITEGLRLMDRYDADSIFDAVEETIDDSYDSFVAEDLYIIINDVCKYNKRISRKALTQISAFAIFYGDYISKHNGLSKWQS